MAWYHSQGRSPREWYQAILAQARYGVWYGMRGPIWGLIWEPSSLCCALGSDIKPYQPSALWIICLGLNHPWASVLLLIIILYILKVLFDSKPKWGQTDLQSDHHLTFTPFLNFSVWSQIYSIMIPILKFLISPPRLHSERIDIFGEVFNMIVITVSCLSKLRLL